jgi:two-component system phosphate regulon sensor histidine kinase PhoR
LESGDITFEREPLDLAQVVEECCADAQAVAQGADVQLTYTAEHCVITASHREMSELVGNLVQNAVKYNHAGGCVKVALTHAKGAPRLTVFNTGEPIAPEHRQRIFERFYRIDKGRSKAAGGTGLGLAIVKHIATGYGAAVWLEVSEQGNTFIVQFPTTR